MGCVATTTLINLTFVVLFNRLVTSPIYQVCSRVNHCSYLTFQLTVPTSRQPHTPAEACAVIATWVDHYNIERPNQTVAVI
jgi:hypothetical protein